MIDNREDSSNKSDIVKEEQVGYEAESGDMLGSMGSFSPISKMEDSRFDSQAQIFDFSIMQSSLVRTLVHPQKVPFSPNLYSQKPQHQHKHPSHSPMFQQQLQNAKSSSGIAGAHKQHSNNYNQHAMVAAAAAQQYQYFATGSVNTATTTAPQSSARSGGGSTIITPAASATIAVTATTQIGKSESATNTKNSKWRERVEKFGHQMIENILTPMQQLQPQQQQQQLPQQSQQQQQFIQPSSQHSSLPNNNTGKSKNITTNLISASANSNNLLTMGAGNTSLAAQNLVPASITKQLLVNVMTPTVSLGAPCVNVAAVLLGTTTADGNNSKRTQTKTRGKHSSKSSAQLIVVDNQQQQQQQQASLSPAPLMISSSNSIAHSYSKPTVSSQKKHEQLSHLKEPIKSKRTSTSTLLPNHSTPIMPAQTSSTLATAVANSATLRQKSGTKTASNKQKGVSSAAVKGAPLNQQNQLGNAQVKKFILQSPLSSRIPSEMRSATTRNVPEITDDAGDELNQILQQISKEHQQQEEQEEEVQILQIPNQISNKQNQHLESDENSEKRELVEQNDPSGVLLSPSRKTKSIHVPSFTLHNQPPSAQKDYTDGKGVQSAAAQTQIQFYDRNNRSNPNQNSNSKGKMGLGQQNSLDNMKRHSATLAVNTFSTAVDDDDISPIQINLYKKDTSVYSISSRNQEKEENHDNYIHLHPLVNNRISNNPKGTTSELSKQEFEESSTTAPKEAIADTVRNQKRKSLSEIVDTFPHGPSSHSIQEAEIIPFSKGMSSSPKQNDAQQPSLRSIENNNSNSNSNSSRPSETFSNKSDRIILCPPQQPQSKKNSPAPASVGCKQLLTQQSPSQFNEGQISSRKSDIVYASHSRVNNNDDNHNHNQHQIKGNPSNLDSHHSNHNQPHNSMHNKQHQSPSTNKIYLQNSNSTHDHQQQHEQHQVSIGCSPHQERYSDTIDMRKKDNVGHQNYNNWNNSKTPPKQMASIILYQQNKPARKHSDNSINSTSLCSSPIKQTHDNHQRFSQSQQSSQSPHPVIIRLPNDNSTTYQSYQSNQSPQQMHQQQQSQQQLQVTPPPAAAAALCIQLKTEQSSVSVSASSQRRINKGILSTSASSAAMYNNSNSSNNNTCGNTGTSMVSVVDTPKSFTLHDQSAVSGTIINAQSSFSQYQHQFQMKQAAAAKASNSNRVISVKTGTATSPAPQSMLPSPQSASKIALTNNGDAQFKSLADYQVIIHLFTFHSLLHAHVQIIYLFLLLLPLLFKQIIFIFNNNQIPKIQNSVSSVSGGHSGTITPAGAMHYHQRKGSTGNLRGSYIEDGDDDLAQQGVAVSLGPSTPIRQMNSINRTSTSMQFEAVQQYSNTTSYFHSNSKNTNPSNHSGNSRVQQSQHRTSDAFYKAGGGVATAKTDSSLIGGSNTPITAGTADSSKGFLSASRTPIQNNHLSYNNNNEIKKSMNINTNNNNNSNNKTASFRTSKMGGKSSSSSNFNLGSGSSAGGVSTSFANDQQHQNCYGSHQQSDSSYMKQAQQISKVLSKCFSPTSSQSANTSNAATTTTWNHNNNNSNNTSNSQYLYRPQAEKRQQALLAAKAKKAGTNKSISMSGDDSNYDQILKYLKEISKQTNVSSYASTKESKKHLVEQSNSEYSSQHQGSNSNKNHNPSNKQPSVSVAAAASNSQVQQYNELKDSLARYQSYLHNKDGKKDVQPSGKNQGISSASQNSSKIYNNNNLSSKSQSQQHQQSTSIDQNFYELEYAQGISSQSSSQENQRLQQRIQSAELQIAQLERIKNSMAVQNEYLQQENLNLKSKVTFE